MKNLSEVQRAMIDDFDVDPDDLIFLHLEQETDDRTHTEGRDCWCMPISMTVREFLARRFDQ